MDTMGSKNSGNDAATKNYDGISDFMIFTNTGSLWGTNCCRNTTLTLREKCSDKEFFLVRIFPQLDWIRRDTPLQRDTPYLSVFSPNAGKYGPEKLRTWTLFTQCLLPIWWVKVFSELPIQTELRDIFRSRLSIYDRAFAKIVNGV